MSVAACSDPEKEHLKKTTIPTYDKKTGQLVEITYDRDKNGKIDTWTEMDGPKPRRSRIDLDEDGKLDRWEYYDDKGGLTKVGLSRKKDGHEDAWAYSGPDGKVARMEISSTGDASRIDRREFYESDALARVEEDTDGNGKVDRWETYENGALKTAAMDESGDGIPDRRLTYADGALVLIESSPEASGKFTRQLAVK